MNCERCGRELNPVEAMIGPVCGICVELMHDELTQSRRSESNLCDNCLTATYDGGARDLELQKSICETMGAHFPDHICLVTEDDLEAAIVRAGAGFDQENTSLNRAISRLFRGVSGVRSVDILKTTRYMN